MIATLIGVAIVVGWFALMTGGVIAMRYLR